MSTLQMTPRAAVKCLILLYLFGLALCFPGGWLVSILAGPSSSGMPMALLALALWLTVAAQYACVQRLHPDLRPHPQSHTVPLHIVAMSCLFGAQLVLELKLEQSTGKAITLIAAGVLVDLVAILGLFTNQVEELFLRFRKGSKPGKELSP